MKANAILNAFALMVLFAVSSVSASEITPRTPKDVFNWLEGGWRFTLGSRSGKRTYRVIEPGHAVAWYEVFDDSDLTGEGITSFVEAEGRFVSLSVHNRADAAGLMFGTPNPDLDEIIYRSQSSGTETQIEIIWRRNGENAFNFLAYSLMEGQSQLLWTADFTRVHQ